MTTKTKSQAKRKPARPTKHNYSKKERLADLCSVVNLCFNLLSDYTHDEIAAMAKLNRSTVYRYWHNDITLAARYGTIQALCAAAGLRMSTDSSHAVVLTLVE